jgi:hypothetical protein
MPYDPIERWEWEGGALAAELDDPRDARPDAAAEQPDEPASPPTQRCRAPSADGCRRSAQAVPSSARPETSTA